MSEKMVLCLLTYNRPEIINEFLMKEIDILYKLKVDLIFYDSSETEATKKIIEHFQKEKYNNLYYNKVDSKVSSNEKFFKVASEIDETYQYVWISHDHTIFNEQALNYIMKSLEKKPDFIYIRKQCQDFNCIIE